MDETKVNQALRLLASLNSHEMTVKEAVAVIELVTNVPELVHETLRIAEEKGLIKRKEGRIFAKRIIPLNDLQWPKPKIKKVASDDHCKRCGRRISICYYIVMEDTTTTIGPLGSECLKKLKLVLS